MPRASYINPNNDDSDATFSSLPVPWYIDPFSSHATFIIVTFIIATSKERLSSHCSTAGASKNCHFLLAGNAKPSNAHYPRLRLIWTSCAWLNCDARTELWCTDWTEMHDLNCDARTELWGTDWTVMHGQNCDARTELWGTDWIMLLGLN